MSSAAIPICVMAFMAWCVYLGGLASIQSVCTDRPDLLPAVDAFGRSCSTAFGWWWFLMSIEFVLVVAVGVAAAMEKMKYVKGALLGLSAICCLLFIEASDRSLRWDTSAPAGSIFDAGYPMHRVRTLAAGSIMLATLNGFLVLALGVDFDSSDHAAHADKEATKEAANAV